MHIYSAHVHQASLDSWSSYLYLQGARITGVYHLYEVLEIKQCFMCAGQMLCQLSYTPCHVVWCMVWPALMST